MGNDGSKRVPSPASADMGFAVSSASDFGTTNRTNDGISSFTNYESRLDDGDDNSGMNSNQIFRPTAPT